MLKTDGTIEYLRETSGSFKLWPILDDSSTLHYPVAAVTDPLHQETFLRPSHFGTYFRDWLFSKKISCTQSVPTHPRATQPPSLTILTHLYCEAPCILNIHLVY